MKNLTNRFISFMLVFALALSLSAPAFAAEYSSTDELDNDLGIIDVLDEIDFFEVEQEETSEDVIREIYANLAPEAKEKALQVIASNPDLLSYYVEEIDPTFSAAQLDRNASGMFSVGAQANDPTKNIERRLGTIGVPKEVILAAVAVASSLVLAAADGPLPFGDAIALFQAGKFAIVLAKHWTVVAPLFGTIIIIFRDEIGHAVNDIIKVMNQVKADAKKEAEKNEDSDERTINPDGLTEKERQGINSALKGSKKGKTTSGRTEQREKKGNYNDALKDFEKIPLSEKKDITTQYGKGKTGKLANGKSVTVRPGSSEGAPTLQIPEGSSRQIEIRYK